MEAPAARGGARMRLRLRLRLLAVAVVVVVMAMAASTARAQLQVGYYDTLCPAAEIIVQEEVSKGVSGSPGTAAGLLRLHFHDCFVRIDKGKEVVTPTEKGKEVVTPADKGKEEVQPEEVVEVMGDDVSEATPAKRRNYGHYAPEVGPNSFCKVVNAAKLESLPMPLEFTKHFPSVPTEFRLKTNTGCAWRVTVRLVDGRVTLDQGWAAFAAVHKIRIGYMVTFKLLTPDTLKVIVFNLDGIEMVNKCGKHDDAYVVNV